MPKSKGKMWSIAIMRMMSLDQAKETWPQAERALQWCSIPAPQWLQTKFLMKSRIKGIYCTRRKGHIGPHVDHLPDSSASNFAIWEDEEN